MTDTLPLLLGALAVAVLSYRLARIETALVVLAQELRCRDAVNRIAAALEETKPADNPE